ncbi:hypothetical protein EIP91_003431 [Steccherinum ochraceum]|uniref:Exonuclease domain-containing protein n=1 Tax=Steccherinum ochraceum TaxID=92696 RepID=A0A4R0RR76_9APHY|nr:hypothetical protein EIP91_003431 [Steccherinum ochraceum]
MTTAADTPDESLPATKKLKVSNSSAAMVSEGLSVLQQEDADEGSWTKVEKRSLKKQKKVYAKQEANPPRFLYARGEITKRRNAVGIDDVRDLVIHILADAPPPSWLRVENHRSIKKVVALLIPGLTPTALSLPPLPTSATSNPNLPLQIPLPEPESPIPFIASTFSHACPTYAPGEQTRMHSVLGAFFQSPVSGEEKKRRLNERVASERAQEKNPLRYMLSSEQMLENDYPMPSYVTDVFEKPEGWVETPQVVDEVVPTKRRILSVDCEMCLTEDGKQLARVCMIDYESGIVVYDKLVKPEKPITDYLTRWSGITAEAMNTATSTFNEVQSHVLSVLSATPTPVLLGHSLESDLKTLQICHPYVIDTAIIYHHPRGRPLKPGLAWLTKKWCGRDIQNRGEGGHDPEEDARACLDLLKKKVDNGAGFGEFKTDYESIFERLSRAKSGALRTAVVDRGNPSSWHGSKATTTVGCKTDEEVLDGLLDVVPSHNFAFGRFTGVADTLGWIVNKTTGEVVQDPSSNTSNTSEPDIAASLSALNAHLQRLYAALPARTALLIFTGHSDPRRMAELNARKNAFETAIRTGKNLEDLPKEAWWTSANGRELEEEVVKAKRGLLFLGIKEAAPQTATESL